MSEDLINEIAQITETLRKENPLIHCITNVVTVKDCANAVLAVGASPIMANAPEEAAEITDISNSLVINIGTLTREQIDTMKKSAKRAADNNKPFILDPVGVGISKIRNETPVDIIKNSKPSIIRGNLSEIKTIAMMYGILDECTMAKGVDAAQTDIINKETLVSNCNLIKSISNKLGVVIAVSGPIDIISDGNEVYSIENGDAIMSNITGSGCMLGCILGAYLTVTTPFKAAVTGTLVMGIAGELAAKTTRDNNQGTGSFGIYLIDELSKMDTDTVKTLSRITRM